MSISPPPTSSAAVSGPLTDAIETLRAESAHAEEDTLRAGLLNELGLLEARSGNDTQAARDLLGAVNARLDFVEPLERLISIIERRRSFKNLGKLLERLTHVSSEPELLARSLTLLAAFLADQTGDDSAARGHLEHAVEAHPTDAVAWLYLEALAAKTADEAARRRALEARAKICRDSAWATLLLCDLATAFADSVSPDETIAVLERAVDLKGESTFHALGRLERAGWQHGRPDIAARALEAQAKLSSRARADAQVGGAFGIPPGERRAESASAARFLAAQAFRLHGDLDSAARLLDEVRAEGACDPALLGERLHLAEVQGETALAAELSTLLLDANVQGTAAATLHMRSALSAVARGEVEEALTALRRAAEQDAACVPARALQHDIVANAGQGGALGETLEAMAEQLSNAEGRSHFLMAASFAWGESARDRERATAVLQRAVEAGAEATLCHRIERALAAGAGQPDWYEQATTALTSSVPRGEKISLLLDVGRRRLARTDWDTVQATWSAIAEVADGETLGAILHAYLGGPADPSADDSLRTLASRCDDPATARAYRVALALRLRLQGKEDEAVLELSSLHAERPDDVLAAVMLSSLARREGGGDSPHAADALARSAEAVADDQLGAALLLEAGILAWQSGDRDRAVGYLGRAREVSGQASAELFAWALRAAEPDDPSARRQALEATTTESPTPLGLVERFALALVAAPEEPAEAHRALASMAAEPGLEVTAALSRALWRSGGSASERVDAIEELLAWVPASSPVACGAAYMATLDRSTAASSARLDAAARWASAAPTMPAALEYLASSIDAADVAAEAQARKLVAHGLDGAATSAMLASAQLVGHLGGVAGTDDTDPAASSPSLRLAALEIAEPGSDPHRRAAALLGAAPLIDDEGDASMTLLAGYNLLAAGDADRALAAFRRTLEHHPQDLAAWEGCRAAATALGDQETAAAAYAALGDSLADDTAGAEMWAAAASLLLDELGDRTRGKFALSRAVARDITRFESFDRLFRMVRDDKDGPRLLELIEARLEVAEEPDEIAKLFWERARVLRQSGDIRGALEALENVAMLEPDHVGALALTGEIYIAAKRFSEAADKLATLARLDLAPKKQRLVSGIAAVDLYENKLQQLEPARSVLEDLHHSGLSTQPVRERLARVAAKTESWDTALEMLEQLMVERDSREGRIEAARLAIAIRRDRLGDPASALGATRALLAEAPDDGEALDLVLSRIFDSDVTAELLDRGRQALMKTLGRTDPELEGAQRLAAIARALDDLPLRQASLGVAAALGGLTTEVQHELDELDERVARTPQMAIDEAAIERIVDPEDRGPILALFRLLAPTLVAALGPGLAAFGVSRRDRVKPSAGLPLRNEIAAWAGSLGVGEFDLYVGGKNPRGVFGVPTEPAAIVIGQDVSAPLSPPYRAAVARETLAIRLGTTILGHREPADIAALVVAACRIGGVELESPPYAMLAEFERVLLKELPRKIRRQLPDLARQIAQSGQDPVAWARAATASLDRVGALAIGDVSWVLGGTSTAERERAPASTEGRERARRLIGFVLSPAFFEVRRQLGMGIR